MVASGTSGRQFLLILDLAALVLAVAPAFYLWAIWSGLPARVPTHFGVNGPDAWGGPANLWLIPGTGIMLFVMIAGAARFPQAWNLPAATTDENREEVLGVLSLMLRALCLETMVIFGYITVASVAVARGTQPGLGEWFLPAAVVVVLGTLAIGVIAARAAARSEPEPE